MQIITIATTKEKGVSDITKLINDLIIKNAYGEGIVHLNVLHTSCCLALGDMDPGGEEDYIAAYAQIVPKLAYKHPHDPGHFPEHALASLIGADLSIPVESATMFLGEWQKVLLIELNGPKERRIAVTFIPEPKPS
jgi:secondary thiamine-phosphate synthase enzyme